MCDDLTEIDNAEFAKKGGALNRRDFSKFTSIAAFTSILPLTACANGSVDGGLVETDVNITMADGVSDSYFVHPANGAHAGVLIWPDILGLRPAFKAMGKRLAKAGYAVLVVNPFYRDAKAPVVSPGQNFGMPDVREKVLPMARRLTQDASMSDARAYIAFLDAQNSVDKSRKIGTAGYCMGGPLIMRTAGALPSRVGAAASFHGGGLVTDRPDSPHLLIPNSPAHVLHAIAENDYEKAPEVKPALIAAYASANVPAEIEVYEGTLHGWCPPDSPVYNEAAAEKAWSRLLALYARALA